MSDTWSGLSTALSRLLGAQYRLGDEAGRGGMGVVFRARDLTLEREVAIKVIHPDLATNRAVAQRFLSEARLIARLRHPHIVSVHAAGEGEGLLFYVMDHVPGETLRQRLQREGALPVDEAIRIASEIGSALDEAARAGVVHRDVKPENILLHATSGRAMLVDFGIAHAISDAAPETAEGGPERTTGPGIAMGTPAYMSPEQAAGEPVEARSDLYALGVVVYEMLTGRPPFDGPRRVVISKQIVDTPAPLDALRPGLPDAVVQAVARALAKISAERWPSGAAFREALHGRRSPIGRVRARARQVILGIAAVATLGATVRISLQVPGPPEGTDPRHSILVLPFANLRSNPDGEWLRDGSVSMLGLALSQWRELSVVDLERLHDLMAGRRIAGQAPLGLSLARRLAREAGVWTVVLGDYTLTGDSLYLVARAYDVRTGARLDIAQAQGSAEDDVRPLFDDLAAKLLDLSGAPATGRNSLSAVTTGSLEAYRRYLQGVDHLNRWDLPEAERDLLAAVAIDSSFSLAYLKLALTRGWRAGADDSLGRRYIGLAAQYGDRLPAREQRKIEAYRAMTAQDYERSRALYAELAASDSTDADAWYGWGDAWFHSPMSGARTEAMTASLRAFRRTLALDPAYHLAYEHVNYLLTLAAHEESPVALTEKEEFVLARKAPNSPLTAAALAQARRRAGLAAVSAARDWVAGQPNLARAQRALFEAELASGDHGGALAAAARIRELATPHAKPLTAFLEARVRLIAGDAGSAAEALRTALVALDPDCLDPEELGLQDVADILVGSNVFAFTGDVAAAARVIALADRVRAAVLPDGAAMDAFGDGRVWRDARLAQLYSATGGPTTELRGLWQRVLSAARNALPSERRALAWAGASAAQGLLLGPAADAAPIEELEALTGTTPGREFQALLAIARGDSGSARAALSTPDKVAGATEGSRADSTTDYGKASSEPLNQRLAFAMGDTRPLAAEAHFLLGNYRTTIKLLDHFDAEHLSTRGFDSRWGLLARVSLLRGLAYEKLGQVELAGTEFNRVLSQWGGADEALQSFVVQAQAGLARIKGARG